MQEEPGEFQYLLQQHTVAICRVAQLLQPRFVPCRVILVVNRNGPFAQQNVTAEIPVLGPVYEVVRRRYGLENAVEPVQERDPVV